MRTVKGQEGPRGTEVVILTRLRIVVERLRSLQQKLDLDGFEREFDSAAFCMTEYASRQQGRDIAMDCFHVAVHSARGFADGNRPYAAERLE